MGWTSASTLTRQRSSLSTGTTAASFSTRSCTRLLNSHLISTFKALPKAPIIADSAEPKSIAELQAAGLNVIPCEKGADSVNFGIKHVQGLPISYTSSSTNLHDEYENYSWKVTKDGETAGIEDPKKKNHLMSAARYGLTMLAGAGTTYDPHQKEREMAQVTVTPRRLRQNGAGSKSVFQLSRGLEPENLIKSMHYKVTTL
jgi:hypothetical protein